MEPVLRIRTRVQKGHRIELHVPELDEAAEVEVVITVPRDRPPIQPQPPGATPPRLPAGIPATHFDAVKGKLSDEEVDALLKAIEDACEQTEADERSLF
ncbi:MAG: hypothetical protein ACK4ME_11545 [Fimbriimonadales bacterium]